MSKTAIVAGASQEIGAGIAKEFLKRVYNVVASFRKATQSAKVEPSEYVALVDRHIGDPAPAARTRVPSSGIDEGT